MSDNFLSSEYETVLQATKRLAPLFNQNEDETKLLTMLRSFFNNDPDMMIRNFIYMISQSSSLVKHVNGFSYFTEKRGRNWKSFLIADPNKKITNKDAASYNAKPFSSLTQEGACYLELSTVGKVIKIFLIRYSQVVSIDVSELLCSKYPHLQGQGHKHVDDVFHLLISQMYKNGDIVTPVIETNVAESESLKQLVENIIRATCYMVGTNQQTIARSKSMNLGDGPHISDTTLHERCSSFYATGRNNPDTLFSNVRTQLSYKDRSKYISRTACNNLGAKLVMEDNAVAQLLSLSCQTSTGHGIEIRWGE